MQEILFFPVSIAMTALWLLILPIIRSIEDRINYYDLKAILSIGWAIFITSIMGYEFINLNSSYIISPDFKGMRILDVVEFRVSKSLLFVGLLVSFLFTIIIFYSLRYLRWETLLDDFGTYKLYYYFLFFSSYLGFQVVLFANDAFLLFVGWEMMVVPGYALVSIKPSKGSAEAGFKYAIISSIGSVFLLYGISILYQITGTFNLDVIKSKVSITQSLSQDLSTWLAIVFILIGLGVTAGFIGFHTWIPDAYGSATSPVGAFISGTFTIASTFALVKLVINVFSPNNYNYSMILIYGGLLTMSIGNLSAIQQYGVRRILGYSSIAQRGYILFGLGIVSYIIMKEHSYYTLDHGFGVIYMYALSFAFLEGTLFLIVGKILYGTQLVTKSRDMRDLRGALVNNPKTALMTIISALGLAGIPPSFGFISKILLVMTTGQSGINNIIIALFLLNSAVSLVYYLRIIKYLLFTQPREKFDMSVTPKTVSIAIFFVSVISVTLGIFPGYLTSVFS